MACIDNGDAYSWTNGSSPTLCRDEIKEALSRQLIRLSNRSIGTAREIESAVIITPLTVNSPVIEKQFEIANALVCVINKSSSGRHLIFQALVTLAHVLALFRAIYDIIKRSLEFPFKETEPQQPSLHGAGSSSARFVMVPQLIMHLVNRIGRSLRIGNRRIKEQSVQTLQTPLTEGGEESSGLQGIVDSA
ncbi:hypothetical protein yc1106_09403 [Curvularia clavata]|uniref:Uncharacterized protein n=1 Tax=Curvularia clavata TaxID=95742 RepID=A0A9Q8ZIJ9_CURCL|nr:hypothetical protein yc1106_09403 [Curvularia clavata]